MKCIRIYRIFSSRLIFVFALIPIATAAPSHNQCTIATAAAAAKGKTKMKDFFPVPV